MLPSCDRSIDVGKLIVLIDYRRNGTSEMILAGPKAARRYAIQDRINYPFSLHIASELHPFSLQCFLQVKHIFRGQGEGFIANCRINEIADQPNRMEMPWGGLIRETIDLFFSTTCSHHCNFPIRSISAFHNHSSFFMSGDNASHLPRPPPPFAFAAYDEMGEGFCRPLCFLRVLQLLCCHLPVVVRVNCLLELRDEGACVDRCRTRFELGLVFIGQKPLRGEKWASVLIF